MTNKGLHYVTGYLIFHISYFFLSSIFHWSSSFSMFCFSFCTVVFFGWLSVHLHHLYRLATRDSLTKAANRHFALMHFDALQKKQQPFELYVVDLDHFKYINDEFGHVTGDQVLVKVTEILRRHTAHAELVSRWGGDEFLLFTQLKTPEERESFLHSIEKDLAGLQEFFHFSVEASLGYSVSQSADSLPELIKKADRAMYHVKNRKKINQAVILA